MKLDDEAKKHGLIASSAWKHAQMGLLIAANKLGVKATIVMPSSYTIDQG